MLTARQRPSIKSQETRKSQIALKVRHGLSEFFKAERIVDKSSSVVSSAGDRSTERERSSVRTLSKARTLGRYFSSKPGGEDALLAVVRRRPLIGRRGR